MISTIFTNIVKRLKMKPKKYDFINIKKLPENHNGTRDSKKKWGSIALPNKR
jgi:hypothetical protein